MIYLSKELSSRKIEITPEFVALPKRKSTIRKFTQDGATGGLLTNGYIEAVFQKQRVHIWAPVK